jgi:hypothetical protein
VGIEPLPLIDLNCKHSGIELRINGIVNWAAAAPPNEGYKLIQLNDADNIVITSTTGPALLTSPLDPETESILPTAIRIVGDCDNITISNLNCSNLSYMVRLDAFEGTRDIINLTNLRAEEMLDYGFFGYANNLTVTNCRVGDPTNLSVQGTYNFHGFRFYGNNQTIIGCTAHNVNRFGCGACRRRKRLSMDLRPTPRSCSGPTRPTRHNPLRASASTT